MDSWYFRFGLVVLGLIAVALFSIPSRSEQFPDAHDRFHHIYKGWTTKEGMSCCNDQDCRPTRIRYTAQGLQMLAENRWIPFPYDKLRPYPSPDGDVHACIRPPIGEVMEDIEPVERRVLCVVADFGA